MAALHVSLFSYADFFAIQLLLAKPFFHWTPATGPCRYLLKKYACGGTVLALVASLLTSYVCEIMNYSERLFASICLLSRYIATKAYDQSTQL
jgi:hypothetical protein